MLPQNIYFCIISAATVIFIVSRCNGWKAVPANQAVYALRQVITFADEDEKGYASTQEKGIVNIPDELLPRTYLHSNFKFGWCAQDSTSRVFLRKSVNMSFSSYGDTLTRYIYRYLVTLSRCTMEIMDTFRFVILLSSTYIQRAVSIPHDLTVCHDNFDLSPPDGILKERTFTWLGFVQYVHITTGLPHHSKAPRVVLVHKQFVMGTATDLLHLPKNYKLGNIVFGDYDREEEDCGLTKTQIRMGVTCGRAYIEIPLTDITAHPEYSRFGVGNSLALVKLIRPMKSSYMVPICLPTASERERKRKTRSVFMVDYISTVPRDFESEKLGKKTLRLYTHRDCRRHRVKSKLGSEGVTHVLCSSGCGVRPGAPIATHSLRGTFQLIGLAAGGAPCSRRSMRRRLNTEPPLYIDVFPYVNWITNVITANILPLPYPSNFRLTEEGGRMGLLSSGYLRRTKVQQKGWKARLYVVGNICFKKGHAFKNVVLFYSERFSVNADPAAKLNLFMKISAGIECTILCAQMLLPNRITTPVVEGIGRYNISIELSTEWFPLTYSFSLGLLGKNSSQRNLDAWRLERKEGYW